MAKKRKTAKKAVKKVNKAAKKVVKKVKKAAKKTVRKAKKTTKRKKSGCSICKMLPSFSDHT